MADSHRVRGDDQECSPFPTRNRLASIALAVVDRLHVAALWALKASVIGGKHCQYAFVLNEFQVLYRAVLITVLIAAIEDTKTVARKILALETKINLCFADLVTTLLQQGALLISRPASGAVWNLGCLGKVVRVRQIMGAHTAVDTTWCDQGLIWLQHEILSFTSRALQPGNRMHKII